jgi:Leucine-rich repeat (LRR) protein
MTTNHTTRPGAFQGSAEPGPVGDSVREDRQPHPSGASVSNPQEPRIYPSVRPSPICCRAADVDDDAARFATRSRLLQNNNITGRLPPELGALPRLQTLDLSNNRFSGRVPDTLGRITTLRYL